MTSSARAKRVLHVIATASIAVALSSPFMPTVAFADTASDLASAQSELAAIGAEYASLQQELRDAAAALEITAGQISETESRIAEAQETLADGVSGDYKAGGINLISMLFTSHDFGDFISRVVYLNKVNQAQAESIQEVKDLQAELEQQRVEQEKTLADTQAKVDAQAANQQQAQALVNSLSAEVRTELESQAASNSDLAAGIQSAHDAESAPDVPITGTDGDAADNIISSTPEQSPQAPETPSQPEQPSQPSQPSQPETSTPPSSTTGSSSVSSPVGYALALEGAPYVWGGESWAEGGFDCSGLVYYAYQQIGITLPRTSDAQMSYVQSYGRFTTNINELQYGDLVFFPGHVAFYVGGGQVFGATVPGQGAGYGSIYWYGTFLGGGQI